MRQPMRTLSAKTQPPRRYRLVQTLPVVLTAPLGPRTVMSIKVFALQEFLYHNHLCACLAHSKTQ